MKTLSSQMGNIQPMLIFWLGVLTGALVVGLVFLDLADDKIIPAQVLL